MLLEVRDLHGGYDGSRVLHGVSLHIAEGERVCLIGRNGVGKTTLLRSIVGLTQRDRGEVRFLGQDVTHWPLQRLARAGLAFVPEDRGIFTTLTVRENLVAGTYALPPGQRPDMDWLYELFPILRERRDQVAGSLSGGEQQMLTIARALVSRPRLLLIDEFSEGLQPSIVTHIAEVLEEVNRSSGTALLLVEQNAHLALSLCQRGYIMEKGQVVMSGETEELLQKTELLQQLLVI